MFYKYIKIIYPYNCVFTLLSNMPKIEELQTKYLQDADSIASKSRLGFFSLPPSATAGHTEFQQKKGTFFFI